MDESKLITKDVYVLQHYYWIEDIECYFPMCVNCTGSIEEAISLFYEDIPNIQEELVDFYGWEECELPETFRLFMSNEKRSSEYLSSKAPYGYLIKQNVNFVI